MLPAARAAMSASVQGRRGETLTELRRCLHALHTSHVSRANSKTAVLMSLAALLRCLSVAVSGRWKTPKTDRVARSVGSGGWPRRACHNLSSSMGLSVRAGLPTPVMKLRLPSMRVRM